MATRRAPAKAEPQTPDPVECGHEETVWNNGQTFCRFCGARL